MTSSIRAGWRALIAVAMCVLALAPAVAVQPDEILSDPVLEARARAISAGLRCLVCQNQSIDDSDAPLARDLRILVRERLEAGDSDADVQAFLVARYGEFVLLKPPFGPGTFLLWLVPAMALVLGAVLVARVFTRGDAPSAEVLSQEEEARLADLLKRDGKESDPHSGGS